MTWDVDFSIGPVQGFMALSRRTRDLWGSSYLLSYLSACAMRGAAEHGEIVQPRMDGDRLYRWVAGDRSDPTPQIGSVPNHFVIRTAAEPRQVADAATQAFHAAWRQVHQAVWDRYVQPICHLGDGTGEIWQRQVEAFWELSWVAASAGQVGGLRARRKHWRTHRPPDEPGDKCTVMPDLQELSGHVRADRGAAAQERFWEALQGDIGKLELRDDERLCAVAMVKRLFAKIGERAIGGELTVAHWPSTVYMGAVPWLRDASAQAREQSEQYARQLRAVVVKGLARGHIPVPTLRDVEPADFLMLDANYYHRRSLANPRTCPLDADSDRRTLGELLGAVYQAAGTPPVYYAFLLADGDELGKLVGNAGGEAVSRALSTFGAQVRDIVGEHDGVTVYAGGDDVLAMLPLPGALACADRLAAAYTASFAAQSVPRATLSAAVLFAQVRMPVGGVLHQAHRLLDEAAKESNGRDSLAVAVLKPGGPHCQWVTSWTRTYRDGRETRAVAQLGELAQAMASEEKAGRGFSVSLLHHLRDTLEVLCGLRQWSPGKTGALPGGLCLREFVHAELVDSWEGRTVGHRPEQLDLTALSGLVQDLLAPSPGKRDPGGHPVEVNSGQAGIDALLLARFLAGGGREEEHG